MNRHLIVTQHPWNKTPQHRIRLSVLSFSFVNRRADVTRIDVKHHKNSSLGKPHTDLFRVLRSIVRENRFTHEYSMQQRCFEPCFACPASLPDLCTYVAKHKTSGGRCFVPLSAADDSLIDCLSMSVYVCLYVCLCLSVCMSDYVCLSDSGGWSGAGHRPHSGLYVGFSLHQNLRRSLRGPRSVPSNGDEVLGIIKKLTSWLFLSFIRPRSVPSED